MLLQLKANQSKPVGVAPGLFLRIRGQIEREE